MRKEKQPTDKQVQETPTKSENGIVDYRFQTPAMCDGMTAEQASGVELKSHWEDFKDTQL